MWFHYTSWLYVCLVRLSIWEYGKWNGSGGKGHQRSFKVIIQVISKYKGDLTKTFVSGIIGKVIYLARGSLTMDIEMLAVVGLDTRGYWRSLTKVIWKDTVLAMGVKVSVAVYYPTGHTTLWQRWITGIASTSQQRCVAMGMSPEVIFRGANSTKGFPSPNEMNRALGHLCAHIG